MRRANIFGATGLTAIWNDDDYDYDVLTPLIRGGSKAGIFLTEHKDTKTQSYFDDDDDR